MTRPDRRSPFTFGAQGAVLALLALGSTQAAAQRTTSVLPGGNPHAPVNVNAPELDYFDKEKKLVYSGGVIARQGEATLKASSLTILLSTSPTQGGGESGGAPGGNQIRRIEAAGPVTVISKDQVGAGDRGVYDRAESKVYLIGHVSLSQGANVIKGRADSKLVYDLASGRAQILGGVDSIFNPGAASDPAEGPTRQKPKSPTKPKAP
jgi:lipopolysaccharide export system protein LptA